MSEETVRTASRPRLDQQDVRLRTTRGPAGVVSAAGRAIREGRAGSVMVLLGLALIVVYFQYRTGVFLRPANLVNLTLQMAQMGVISIGIVGVLLLGEIDLSAGSVSGFTACIMAVEAVRHGVPDLVAILLAIATGVALGLLHGLLITKARVPAFIVTLAGFLSWQGVQLTILGSIKTITLPDHSLAVRLVYGFVPPLWSYLVAGVAVLVYAALAVRTSRRRSAAGLTGTSPAGIAARAIGLAVALFAVAIVLNRARGLSYAVVLMVALVVVFDLIYRRSRYGRYIYAIGGDSQAALRAGIKVSAIRVSVFATCSGLAALGGLIGAGRLYSAGAQSGGSDLLLDAIAAAVIGGTSLFGGRGSSWSALLGTLVIATITNGLLLLGLESNVQFTITGIVLLLAVLLDSLSRRRSPEGR
ncbi:sugar ABC transporter permease [Rugosimonospora africana]|uniref:Xylose transport system permease protein XylH n=1 Tax=Rugosimonospora africana TaxID=556532 RepID=A0A8J3QQU2_9ACTN|nr:sugar ABC transporter permease [Rugosimonospora africana]GIH14869.1 ABC transporter permease [Rugosimonospora africana]